LMLFYTGSQRNAREVLSHQVISLDTDDRVVSQTQKMVGLAYDMRDYLLRGELDQFGFALHRGWELKRSISDRISTLAIDEVYARARGAGALGGKLTGAGGGGFLLLYCPKNAQTQVCEALSALQRLDFRFDWGGARIAFAQ
jgi:D-glycero-alpha-D-manno-heptose-7-phosphate kinase